MKDGKTLRHNAQMQTDKTDWNAKEKKRKEREGKEKQKMENQTTE